MSRWRHFMVVGTFILMSLGLSGRMAYLNVTERAFLQGQGDARSLRYETLAANRGIIFDRNGEPLAVSTPVVSVWIDPTEKSRTAAEITNLARAVGVDPRELSSKVERYSQREFMFVKRRIAPDEAERVEKLHLEGVHFEREYRRYYPAGETAAHVVGITNVDDEGQEGAELAFEGALKSVQGRKLVLKNGSKESIKDAFLKARIFAGLNASYEDRQSLPRFHALEFAEVLRRCRALGVTRRTNNAGPPLSAMAGLELIILQSGS